MSYLPNVLNKQFQAYLGISHIRDAIVEHLQEHEILRPIYNTEEVNRPAGSLPNTGFVSKWCRMGK